MTRELLVCPGCRTRTDDRIDVRTLTWTSHALACECGCRYPIIDGVPVVTRDPIADLTAIVERDLAPEVVALLVAEGPDDASYPRLIEHLSIYLDAHWGDRAEPPPDGPGAGFASALVDRIAALPRTGLVVELGCSVGRTVAELARTADHVVGIDLQHAAVRRARKLLDGDRVAYARRELGRHYSRATVAAGDRAVPADRRTLLCGDALDPPLIPGTYDRAVALNVVDAVPHPRQLLSVMDLLLVRGGELVLSSPYAWQSSVLDDAERIGGADPAADLAAILRAGHGLGSRYELLDEAELPWTLRRDARSAIAYRVHYLRARKT